MQKLVKEDLYKIIDGVGLDTLRKFEGKEVLITGACGFLGSWFVAVFQELNRHYFTQPVKVWAIDSMIAADQKNAIAEITDNSIQFQEGDVSKMEIQGTVDYIIHAAGIASPIYYRRFPIETIDGMAFGLRNLLNYAVDLMMFGDQGAHELQGFLYFSSSEIYGNPTDKDVPTPETYNGNVSCIGPRSCYDEAKRMGETMCHSYHRKYQIPVTWVRPFNVYGPGMRFSDDRVVPKFTIQILRGLDVTVHLPGHQTRTFCYITDAMIGFFKALLIGKRGEVYNIGCDSPEMSIHDLAQGMFELWKPEKSKLIEVQMPEEYPTDQAQRRCPKIDKAAADLGFRPIVPLASGLQRTYNFFKEALEEEGHNAKTSNS